MNTTNSDTNQSTATVREPYTTGSVTSKDGTTIGYRQLGHGPAVVLLHGAASSGYNHMQLAEALADAFTVYVPDRRGHDGLSGPGGEDYSIRKEVEDMDALLTKTGAHHVFGVSSGGIIWLQAALTLSAIHKAVINEPPFFMNDLAKPTAILTRLDMELARGKVDAALITSMKGGQMGPRVMNAMPRWLLELLFSMGMKSEEKKGSGGYVPMRELAPALHYDFQLVVEMHGKLERFRDVRAEVLLLGGSRSPAFLKADLDVLEKILPHVKRIELPGVGHAASWNTDRGGQPEVVAQTLRRFFAEPEHS